MTYNTFDRLMALRELPEAYEQWSGYRRCLTDYILSNTAAGTSAMIVGAGRCNDLELNALAEHFSLLQLLDIDTDAIKNGLKKQFKDKKEIPANIILTKADLVGIPETLFRGLCTEIEQSIRNNRTSLKRAGTIENKTQNSGDFRLLPKDSELSKSHEADCIFEKYLEQGSKKAEKNNLAEKYFTADSADYVICCGVHSQLNNVFSQLAELYQNYTELNTARIFAYASKMNGIISEKVNSAIFNCARKGAIFALESGRLGIDGGIEGAAQAMDDIIERIRSGGCKKEEKETIWPFSIGEGKIYNMKLINISFEN